MIDRQSEEQITEYELSQVANLLDINDVSRIRFNNNGWDSRVYSVDNYKFVFKFPRTEEIKKGLEQELNILRELTSVQSAVILPKLRWVSDDLSYIGYEGVVGRTLEAESAKLNNTMKRKLGKNIGIFLRQLHQIKLNSALVNTIEDEITQFQKYFNKAKGYLAVTLNKQDFEMLKRLVFIESPEEIRRLGENLVICHGDLQYQNMILTAEADIGIIDFGDSGYYDNSKDFIGIECDEMLEAAVNSYGFSENLIDKIKIRKKLLPLLDLPYYIEHNEKEDIAKTLNRIKQSIGA